MENMSNEIEIARPPPRAGRPAKKFNASGRYRRFSCITYLNENQLKMCLIRHHEQIRVWAYALHDKDTKEDGTLKEPHFHLVIITYNGCTVSAVRRWFSGFKDENGAITTTAQVCADIYEMYDYLTHDTVQAKLDGKNQYSKDIVQTSDREFFKASLESEYDSITLAAEFLLKGKSIHQCGRIFGRDFILHYNAIKNYLMDILQSEKDEYINNFEDLIFRQTANLLEGKDKNNMK